MAVFGFLAGLQSAAVVYAEEREIDSTAVESTTAESAGESAVDYRRQRVINQTLLRQPEAGRLLEQLEQYLSQGRQIDAVRIFQLIMQLPQDSFFWQQDQIHPLHQQALTLLGRHREAWAVYQQLYAARASQLLDLKSESSCRQVAREYYFTPAGRSAVLQLAAHAWDAGEITEAARLWRQLVSTPQHAGQLSPKQFEQVLLISQLTNDLKLQTDVRGLISQRQIRLQRSEVEIANIAINYQWVLESQRDFRISGWSQPVQGQLDVAFSQGRTPPMPQPAWLVSREIFQETVPPAANLTKEKSLRQSLKEWSHQQHEQFTPELTAMFAVVAGDVLVYRELDTVRAVCLSDVNSGQTETNIKPRLWQYHSPVPLVQAYEYESDPFTGMPTNQPAVDRLYLSNSAQGSLTTDGQRVYLVDSVTRLPLPASQVASEYILNHEPVTPASIEPAESLKFRLVNRLVALPTLVSEEQKDSDGSLQQPVWQIDQRGHFFSQERGTGKEPERESLPVLHPLQGHFFLGPPVVAGQKAFVLSESNHHIQLSALNRETGEFVWSQAISYADRAIDLDVMRATRVCLPVYASGLVLCDNGNGQLIAVDSSLGTLAWTYCYIDEDSRQSSGRWTYTQSSRSSQAGALNLPVVSGGHVLLAPDRSKYVQAISLETGKLQWKTLREDTEYLAGVRLDSYSRLPSRVQQGEGIVLAVGARKCRAILVDSGEVFWESRIGFLAGHGVQVGGNYLIPVSRSEQVSLRTQGDKKPEELLIHNEEAASRGKIVVLDLLTGKRSGYELSVDLQPGTLASRGEIAGQNSSFSLGNLLACHDVVVAVGVHQLTGFRQAGAVAAELEELAGQTPLTEAQWQARAQAALVLGELSEAKQYLQAALSRNNLDQATRLHTQKLYRELLYQELHQATLQFADVEQFSILEELEQLADSPEQKARYLLTEIELLLHHGQYEKLWRTTDHFVEMGLQVPFLSQGERGHFSTSSSWMPEVYEQLLSQMTPQEQQTLLQQMEQKWLTRLGELSNAQLASFLDVLSFQSSSRATNDAPGGRGGLEDCRPETAIQDREEAQLAICAIRDTVRLELVGRAVAAGELQRAELLLLELSRSGQGQIQGLALQELINLYSRLGFYTQAAEALQQLSLFNKSRENAGSQPELSRLLGYVTSRKFAIDEPIQLVSVHKPPAGSRWLNSADYVSSFDTRHPSWNAYLNRPGNRGRVEQVSIEQRLATTGLVADPYSQRRMLYQMPQSGWQVMLQADRGSEKPEGRSKPSSREISGDEQQLLVLNPESGQVLNRIALTGVRISLSNQSRKHVGHLLPVLADGQLLGISLLEGRPVWQRNGTQLELLESAVACLWESDAEGVVRSLNQKPQAASRQNRRVELGPVGTGYCIIQTAHALACLDPMTGQLLWKRIDLDPQGGMWVDRTHGLFGDEQVLVYFHPDQNQYTLLQTRTGEVLRRGRLEEAPAQVQQTRHVWGRHLMYITVRQGATPERRLRLWDPVKNSFRVDEAYGTRDLYHAAPEELTLLLSSGRLLIVNPVEQGALIDCPLSDEILAKANYLRVSKNGDRYLVNLYQTQRLPYEKGYASRYTDAPWKLTHVNGPVLSIHRETGQLEWVRQFSSRSIVDDEAGSLPFLVMCANYQTRPGDQDRSLMIEVVDIATGETLAYRDDLPVTRLILMSSQRELKQLELTGLNAQFVVEYQELRAESKERRESGDEGRQQKVSSK